MNSEGPPKGGRMNKTIQIMKKKTNHTLVPALLRIEPNIGNITKSANRGEGGSCSLVAAL